MGEYLRAGSLVLKSTSQGCFEILQLVTEHKGILVASGEVTKSPYPTLHINRLQPRERMLDMRAASVDKMVLHTCSEADPTDYELKAVGADEDIEILLSGHHGYRCFWWRADIKLENGEINIRGPILASDNDS